MRPLATRNDSPSATAPRSLQDRHPAARQALKEDPVSGSGMAETPAT